MSVKQKSLPLLWLARFPMPILQEIAEIREWVHYFLVPSLEQLDKYEKIRSSLLVSGELLDFLSQHEPLILKLLQKLHDRGQVEMIGDGFHNPVLRMIPEADIIRHLHKMTMLLDQWFPADRHKKGIWLSASEWETDFPRVLQESGIDFTLLEESIFLASGVKPADLFKPYRTENLGKSIIVFPDHRILARQILSRKSSEILGSFRAIANRPDVQVLPLSFSAPPFLGESKEWYTQVQLDSWFEVLQAPWVETRHFVDLVHDDHHYPVCYLSPGCSSEVAARLLPPDAQEAYERCFQDLKPRFDFDRFKPFLHGGNWNGVFAHFPEVQHLQKKMLWLRDLVYELKDPTLHRKAETLLLSSQHYNPFLEYPQEALHSFPFRESLHQKLIQVEKIIATDQKGLSFLRRDYDGDGLTEIRMSTRDLSVILKPNEGGSLVDIADLKHEWSFSNVLTRNRHFAKSNPKNLGVEDWHPRRFFQDHFIKSPVTLEEMSSMQYVELGDFTRPPYQVLDQIRASEEIQIRMKREGGVYLEGDQFPVTVYKTVSLTSQNVIRADYEVQCIEKLPLSPWFAVEMNLASFDSHGGSSEIMLGEEKRKGDESFSAGKVDHLCVRNKKLDWNLDLHFTSTDEVFHYPIGTPHPQGSVIQLLWKIPMRNQESYRFSIQARIF